MSLVTQLKALVDSVAGRFNLVSTRMGTLANLQTTAKSSLVSAINELTGRVTAGTGAQINDNSPSLSTTYSGTKVEAVAAAAVAAVVDAAPESLNTLREIADKLSSDDTALAGLLQTLGVRVAVDVQQSFSTTQQAQARANIGAVASADVGDTTRDFVADFNAALQG